MTLPTEVNLLLAANQGGYRINQSLRLRASASAYLDRTMTASFTSQRIFTFSFWLKRGTLSTAQSIFDRNQSTNVNQFAVGFNSDNTFAIVARTSGTSTVSLNLTTSAVFRDPSAWYHFFIAVDNTQATLANRGQIYVNGVLQALGTQTVTQNVDYRLLTGLTYDIGRTALTASQYFDGYLAEFNFIDGQQLTPSSFGETNNATGVWSPKRYTGTYGNNGFYLPFPNSNTGTAITADYLVVAGGGGGGSEINTGVGSTGGGGGAGGFLTGTTSLNSALTYAVTVGAGGAGAIARTTAAVSGGNSVFNSITATGGGRGGNDVAGPATGGSGGGGQASSTGSAGTSGQGNAGGNGGGAANGTGGGGGGASAVGGNATASVAGNGGAGSASSISGSSVNYGGGGGGGAAGTLGKTAGTGGVGGGGNGATGGTATSGTANTGGGGGGAGQNGANSTGGAGGSGVVIVSYAGAARFSGGTITSSGGNTIHTFTTSGALTAIFSDFSGNGNNWTGYNFNVSDTTAVTYDSMIDVPTQYADGGNGRGNYAVANPVNAASGLTVSDGNLKIASSTGGSKFVNSSIALPASGAYYAEITCGNATTNLIGQSIGVQAASRGLTSAQNAANAYLFYGTNAGVLVSNTTTTASGLSAISANEVFQIAVDVTNSRMWIGRSNVWYNSTGGTTGNPSTGANPTFTAAFVDYFIYSGFDTTSAVSANFNFGQRPFTYTPPTGFKALNTLNLPAPTILKGEQYMNATLWNGNSTNATVITTTLGTVDFAWVKRRNGIDDHRLANTVTGGNRHLKSNSTDAESTATTIIQAFSGGTFTLGTDGSVNATGGTYVGWTWQAGGTAVTNTAGSISSQVSAGGTQGCSVVTYTGNGTGGATVGHGLGVAPSMMVIKDRTTVGNWPVYHASIGATNAVFLNLTNASAATSTAWNNTAPTSSVFSLGTSTLVNGSGNNYVAYLFSEVAGYSKFGSYTGNGSADGTFVFLGFRPRFLLVKRTDTTANWFIADASRSTYNVVMDELKPNLADAEVSTSTDFDFLSNGFKLRLTAPSLNGNGGTFIYAAFAENPFKNALAR